MAKLIIADFNNGDHVAVVGFTDDANVHVTNVHLTMSDVRQLHACLEALMKGFVTQSDLLGD